MADEMPMFLVEKDNVGLGYCVIATWPDGRQASITGLGDTVAAQGWIVRDAEEWLKLIPRDVSGEQWVNNRLPKTQ